MPKPSRGPKGRRGSRRDSAKRVEGGGGGGGRPAIFHRFRVQANFNNIRSIRYSRPHIKSVRANEAPAERRNMMSGGQRVKRGEKRTRVRWHDGRREERPCRRIGGWKRPKGTGEGGEWPEEGAE